MRSGDRVRGGRTRGGGGDGGSGARIAACACASAVFGVARVGACGVAAMAVLAAGVLAGCGGDAGPTPVTEQTTTDASRTDLLFPGLDQGLRLRRVRVEPDALPHELGAIVAAAAVPVPPDAVEPSGALEQFAANGMRIATVPVDRVPALIDALGAPGMRVEAWHGEAPTWRTLAARDNTGRVRALVTDGGLQRFESGAFEFRIRAWTMAMESGPHLQIEMRVEHRDAAAPRRDLLARPIPVPATVVDGCRAEVAAPRGLAWVLVPSPAGDAWPEPGTPLGAAREIAPRPVIVPPAPSADDDGGGEGDDTDGASDSGPAGGRAGDRDDRDGGVGPDAGRLRTIGEALFEQEAMDRTYEVLILIPELPARLDPAPLPASTVARGGSA